MRKKLVTLLAWWILKLDSRSDSPWQHSNDSTRQDLLFGDLLIKLLINVSINATTQLLGVIYRTGNSVLWEFSLFFRTTKNDWKDTVTVHYLSPLLGERSWTLRILEPNETFFTTSQKGVTCQHPCILGRLMALLSCHWLHIIDDKLQSFFWQRPLKQLTSEKNLS